MGGGSFCAWLAVAAVGWWYSESMQYGEKRVLYDTYALHDKFLQVGTVKRDDLYAASSHLPVPCMPHRVMGPYPRSDSGQSPGCPTTSMYSTNDVRRCSSVPSFNRVYAFVGRTTCRSSSFPRCWPSPSSASR
jgi:hypothetical protein